MTNDKFTIPEDLESAYKYAEANVKDYLADWTIKETEDLLRKNIEADYHITNGDLDDLIKQVLYTPEIEAYATVMATRN